MRAGRLRLLAVASARRSGLFPQTPTLSELGLKDFDAGSTHGFYVPAGTPPAVVDRLNREINRLLLTAEVSEPIRAIGAEPTPMSPAEFARLLAQDSERYARIVRERRITAE